MGTVVKLIKRERTWVTELLGAERNFQFDLDENSTWRSLGIHPEGAVQFECDMRGNLEKLVLCKTGEELDYLEIPKNNQLSMLITVTTRYAA